MDSSAGAPDLLTMDVPDCLPTLDRGGHRPDEHRACAMEAASWLAGEPWSDRPRSVHPVIARVARAANDNLDDTERQGLWPLILASLDTAHPWKPFLHWRLERLRRRSRAHVGSDLRELWVSLLAAHARSTRCRPISPPIARFIDLELLLGKKDLSTRERGGPHPEADASR